MGVAPVVPQWFVTEPGRSAGAPEVCTVIMTVVAAQRPEQEDEKGTRLVSTPGGAQEMLHINEPGLYRLLMRSDKPKDEKGLRSTQTPGENAPRRYSLSVRVRKG